MATMPIIGGVRERYQEWHIPGSVTGSLTTSRLSLCLARRVATVVIPLKSNEGASANYISKLGRDTYEIRTPDSHPSFTLHPPGSFDGQVADAWRLTIIGDERWSCDTLDIYLKKIVETLSMFM